MSGPVKAIPEGYHSVTPYLLVRGAQEAMAFYAKVFGAKEIMKLVGSDGRVGHAEISIGSSRVMLADEHPEMDFLGPQSRNGTTVTMLLYVENVDDVFDRAIEAGATELRPLCDQFYGDRSGTLTDPWGHIWTIATHIEDVSQEEMDRRFREMFEE
ncbi:MAG: VOC family protein [Planctomycetaceae bacterium]|nr:VOC family protein [Planctomycetaceae bacterium]